MSKAISWLVILVLLIALAVTLLVVLKVLPFLVWLVVVLPLISGLIGWVIAFALAASGLLKEELTKDVFKFCIGAASGITIAKFNGWWKIINDFLADPKRITAIVTVGACLFTLLLGFATGLYVGLKSKPAVKQAGGTSAQALIKGLRAQL